MNRQDDEAALGLEHFDYELPASAIAQRPENRGDSRLLVLDEEGSGRHRHFRELPQLLMPTDLLVLNNTRVLRARLEARRETGGRIEILLLEPVDDRSWVGWLRPASRPKPLETLWLDSGFTVRVGRRLDEAFELEFSASVEEVMAAIGHTPLPPYIDRPDDERDESDYQTVFARVPGAIAAPTAGLHFGPETLAQLRQRGLSIAEITLHVGPGTFRPITTSIERHRMHAERYTLSHEAAAQLEEQRRLGRRIVAVGTTVVRTLETVAQRNNGRLVAESGSTDLFVRPGYCFRVVDSLITNFHLPRSTLLLLVAAFCGRERLMEAYQEALSRGYRFYSYGDAMLVDRTL